MARGRSIEEVESEVKGVAQSEDHKDLALIFATLASRLSVDYSPGRNPADVVTYANRAFELWPHNFKVASVLLGQLNDPQRGREVSRKLLECGKNLPDELVAQLSNLAGGLEEFTAVLESRRLRLHESYSFNTTRYHYRAIHRLLKDSGASLIAMQYPTLPVEKLKAHFQLPEGKDESSRSDITYVSNQENFAYLLQNHKYEEVFIDRFKGNWGHTTDLGHEAIAEAALKGVQGELAKREGLREF